MWRSKKIIAIAIMKSGELTPVFGGVEMAVVNAQISIAKQLKHVLSDDRRNNLPKVRCLRCEGNISKMTEVKPKSIGNAIGSQN